MTVKKLCCAVGGTLLIIVILNACSTVNNALLEKKKTVEYYHIFDIKTAADRTTVMELAAEGLGANVTDASISEPIPSFASPPEKPGRFKVSNVLKGTGFQGYAALSGQTIQFKMATCDEAIWTARANRDIDGDKTRITACLFQYQQGYHLNIHFTFTKTSGGLQNIHKYLAQTAVGTAEEWNEKTFLDIVRAIHSGTKAEITYVEGYPKMAGTPWLDQGGTPWLDQE